MAISPPGSSAKNGHVAGTITSGRGMKQGCVLGSLGFVWVIQPAYEACVAGLAVSAEAVMDDFTLIGPPAAVFEAFDHDVMVLCACCGHQGQ